MKHRLQLQGRWTNSDKELVAEVEQIRTFCATLGLKPFGYDPGVMCCDASNPELTVDIPLWFLKRLMEKLN
jgi:hypothetical protein